MWRVYEKISNLSACIIIIYTGIPIYNILEEVTPQNYLQWVNGLRHTASSKEEKEEMRKQVELARVYEAFQRLLLKNSYLDFGDLIIWTIKLFNDRPSILKRYRDQFTHIFVDEFQDTNSAQNRLIFSLAKLVAMVISLDS